MSNIYEALQRVEKLYNSKNKSQTAKILKIPFNTFYDNYKKAKKDFELIKSLEDKPNQIKKDLLEKRRREATKRYYANSLYQHFIELAKRDNLNLNWLFYGFGTIHNNDNEILSKVVEAKYLKDSLGADFISIPYFESIDYEKEKNSSLFIVLPKSILQGDLVKAFFVSSDNMLPNIKTSSIVFVDFSKKALINSSVYLVEVEGIFKIHRLESTKDEVLLRSDNTLYSTEIVKKENINIIGQVIGNISTNINY